jgi:hypothetical protein
LAKIGSACPRCRRGTRVEQRAVSRDPIRRPPSGRAGVVGRARPATRGLRAALAAGRSVSAGRGGRHGRPDADGGGAWHRRHRGRLRAGHGRVPARPAAGGLAERPGAGDGRPGARVRRRELRRRLLAVRTHPLPGHRPRSPGAREAVRPGGRVLGGAWARGRFALYHALHAALARTVPGYTPPAGPPAFMGLGSADDLSGAFRRAGLDDVTVTEVTHGCRIDDPERFFVESPSWSPPLQPALEAMTPPVRADAAGARGCCRCAQTPPLRSPGRWQRSAGTPAWSRRPCSPAPSAERRRYRTTARVARRSADPPRVSRLRAGAGRCRRRRRPGPAP